MAGEQDRTWSGSMPEAYERGLEQAVFAPFAAELARRAAAGPAPRRVVELAAGTGVVTRALADALPGASLLATDLNPAMVAHGARSEPRARWQRADAAALPLADGSADLVCCGFGVMFFPDRPAAHREVARVLAPGGRYLFTVWDAVGTHGFARALTAGLAHAFPGDPPTFVSAVPHGYHDPERIRADLAAGGLRATAVDRVELAGTAASAAAVARGFCTGTPLLAQLRERGDDGAAVDVIARVMTEVLGEGPVSAPMAAFVVDAEPAV